MSSVASSACASQHGLYCSTPVCGTLWDVQNSASINISLLRKLAKPLFADSHDFPIRAWRVHVLGMSWRICAFPKNQRTNRVQEGSAGTCGNATLPFGRGWHNTLYFATANSPSAMICHGNVGIKWTDKSLAKAPKLLLSIFSLLLLLFYFRGNTLVQSFLSTFQCSDFSMWVLLTNEIWVSWKKSEGPGHGRNQLNHTRTRSNVF